MKNRVTVTIAGQEYTLVGTEEASYTEKVAAHVDAKVEEVLSGAHVSLVDGAILAAVNIADEYFKEVEAAENLRRQLKEQLPYFMVPGVLTQVEQFPLTKNGKIDRKELLKGGKTHV